MAGSKYSLLRRPGLGALHCLENSGHDDQTQVQPPVTAWTPVIYVQIRTRVCCWSVCLPLRIALEHNDNVRGSCTPRSLDDPVLFAIDELQPNWAPQSLLVPWTPYCSMTHSHYAHYNTRLCWKKKPSSSSSLEEAASATRLHTRDCRENSSTRSSCAMVELHDVAILVYLFAMLGVP